MYFSSGKKLNILKIKDNFASLLNIDVEGLLEFEFAYSILQSEAIKNSATKVVVSVYDDSPVAGDLGLFQKQDSISKINSILTDFSNKKSSIIKRGEFLVAQQDSDISAHIDNSTVLDIRRGFSIEKNEEKIVLKQALSLKKKKEKLPLLYQINLSKDEEQKRKLLAGNRELSFKLLLEDKIDPSRIVDVSSIAVNTHELFQGLGKTEKNTNDNVENLSLLNDRYVFDNTNPKLKLDHVDDSSYVATISTEASDEITVPVVIKFKEPESLSYKEKSKLFVKFELIDVEKNVPIQVIVKDLFIREHMQLHLTPTDAPHVTTSDIDKLNSTLSITQVSSVANVVKVYKKNVYLSYNKIEDYSLIKTISLRKGETFFLNVERAQHPIIYRCISANGDKVCSTFTSVVVSSVKNARINSLSLTSFANPTGLTLEARYLPVGTVAAQFLVKNLSNFEKFFSPVSGRQILVDSYDDANTYISDNATGLIDGDLYQFAVKVYFLNGDSLIAGNETIEYTLYNHGFIDINVTNLKIQNDDVTFDVNLSTSDSDIDQAKNALERQGISLYFEGDINSQRDQLKSLLAYSVKRTNLITGEDENLGTFTDTKFSDAAARAKTSANRLEINHRYRYTVTAIVRTAESLFASFKKTKTDPATRKNYVYQPAKYLHPFTLKKSVILNISDYITAKKGKSALEHGITGSSFKLDVKFDVDKFDITESSITRVGKDKIVLKWRSKNNLNDVDHFVICKEILGIRTPVSVAHNQFESGMKYVHIITKSDIGQMRFLIFPIMKNYVKGQAFATSEILIEDL